MSYRQLLANLEALSGEDQQLAAGVYLFRDVTGREVCGCVLGKGVPAVRSLVRSRSGLNTNCSIIANEFDGVDLAGMSRDEAIRVQNRNDEYQSDRGHASHDNSERGRHRRYRHIVKWLRARVAEEVTSAASAAIAAPSEVRPLRAGGKEEA